jgi:hypothetical protein
MSPYLLLPDSFGEIYLGEKFSAYIAVVNGSSFDNFHQVSLSVQLQTANVKHDLLDYRSKPGELPGPTKVLAPGEMVDMVVQHKLNELGFHTLRVSVQYLNSRSNEPKTLRKFYRFPVYQPLSIESTCTELKDKIVVQSVATNATTHVMYIEKVHFLPSQKDATVTYLNPPNSFLDTYGGLLKNDAIKGGEDDPEPLGLFNMDSLPLLQPNESYAYALTVSKSSGSSPPASLTMASSGRSVGIPEFHWYMDMGEHGVVRGEEVSLQRGPRLEGLRVECVSNPSTAAVGVEFKTTLRITNGTSQTTAVTLRCNKSSATGKGFGFQSDRRSSAGQQALTTPSRTSQFNVADRKSAAPTIQRPSLDGRPSNASLSTGTGGDDGSSTPGLCVTGLVDFHATMLSAGESAEVPVTVCALRGGLLALDSVSLLDTISDREYPGGVLFEVFVYDDNVNTKQDEGICLPSANAGKLGHSDSTIGSSAEASGRQHMPPASVSSGKFMSASDTAIMNAIRTTNVATLHTASEDIESEGVLASPTRSPPRSPAKPTADMSESHLPMKLEGVEGVDRAGVETGTSSAVDIPFSPGSDKQPPSLALSALSPDQSGNLAEVEPSEAESGILTERVSDDMNALGLDDSKTEMKDTTETKETDRASLFQRDTTRDSLFARGVGGSEDELANEDEDANADVATNTALNAAPQVDTAFDMMIQDDNARIDDDDTPV